jgi:TolA-binding protein
MRELQRLEAEDLMGLKVTRQDSDLDRVKKQQQRKAKKAQTNAQNRQITARLDEVQGKRSELEKQLSDNRRAEEELREQLKSSQKPKYRRDQPPLRPALYQPTEHLDTEPAPSTSGHFYPRNDPFGPPAIDATMEYSDVALWAIFETLHPSQT